LGGNKKWRRGLNFELYTTALISC